MKKWLIWTIIGIIVISGLVTFFWPEETICPELEKLNCTKGFSIITNPKTGCKSYICLEDQIAGCKRDDGNWTSFSDGCGDKCNIEICGLIGIDSCDCGPDNCWDGNSCVSL